MTHSKIVVLDILSQMRDLGFEEQKLVDALEHSIDGMRAAQDICNAFITIINHAHQAKGLANLFLDAASGLDTCVPAHSLHYLGAGDRDRAESPEELITIFHAEDLFAQLARLLRHLGA